MEDLDPVVIDCGSGKQPKLNFTCNLNFIIGELKNDYSISNELIL